MMQMPVVAARVCEPSDSKPRRRRLVAPMTLFAAGMIVAACGGGSSPGSSGTTPTAGGTISGTATKGPVSGATMTAFAVANGAKGAQLGTATTDPQGRFTVPVGDHSGPVMLELSGGTFTDEATEASMPMQAGDVMAAILPAVAAGATTTGIQVTPLTSMARARAQNLAGGMTDANITAANAAIGSYFSVNDVLHTAPMNPLVAGSGAGATQDMKNYGMVLGAMSQYAKSIGMTTSSSGLVTAMMNDASDGVMNGMMGSTPISMAGMGGMMGSDLQPSAGSAGLAAAMSQFVGSAMNRSGVTLADMQPMIDLLTGSTGALPGATGGSTAGMLSGTAFMGTVASGTINASAIDGNGAIGPVLATGTVDGAGHFNLAIGSYSGPVMLRLAGGTYADEATGSTMTMLPADVMTAAVPSVAAGSTVSGIFVTPLTSMAQARAQNMAGGMTDANVTAANAAVGSYFSVNEPLHTAPMNPLVPGSGTGATQDSRNYGMTIAAMSQYAKTIGMTTSSSGIVTVMMDDASDGVMNGSMRSTPISMGGMGGMMMGGNMQSTAGTTGLSAAMTAFIDDTAVNRSGLTVTEMQALITKLAGSSGVIQ